MDLKISANERPRVNPLKSDVFSLGLLFLFVLTENLKVFTQHKTAAAQCVLEQFSTISLSDIISKMLDRYPDNRPNAMEIKQCFRNHKIQEVRLKVMKDIE